MRYTIIINRQKLGSVAPEVGFIAPKTDSIVPIIVPIIAPIMDTTTIQTLACRLGLLLVAGGTGAVARYALSAWLNSCQWCGKPWGILVCNLLGCFLIGLLTVVLTRHCSSETKLIIITGFLGAFTTFSTYLFDTVDLLEKAKYATAGINLLLHNALGISMVVAGLTLGRFVVRS